MGNESSYSSTHLLYLLIIIIYFSSSGRYIGCGRKLYGVVDSGCLTGEEGAAVLHWEENRPARPLAVKLGTITPSSADVYSYAEDTMVVDSKLAEHLAHFGINIQKVCGGSQCVSGGREVVWFKNDYVHSTIGREDGKNLNRDADWLQQKLRLESDFWIWRRSSNSEGARVREFYL